MISLPKQIRQDANQAAHRMALRYELETRIALLAQLKQIAESGATLEELIKALTRIEAQTPRK